jgi:hypothetical protein
VEQVEQVEQVLSQLLQGTAVQQELLVQLEQRRHSTP